jgi:hypothetical protein
MARNVATSIQNNFIGGLVTQATALNFPQNAAFDADNVVFSERGIVSRRFGFDFENNFTKETLTATGKVQTTYHWKNVSGDGTINFVVHQNGGMLYFYDANNQLSLSAGLGVNSIDIGDFIASGATQANLDENECQFSAGLGYLFGTHPYCDPFYVKYNSDGTFTSALITFTIRDLIGISEAALVDNRPGSLTDTHKYNLFNQGWDATKYGTFFTAASSKYPSNADRWWLFKDSTNVFNPGTMLGSISSGSSPAPKGYFRLNPWDTDRAAVALAQAGITVTLTGDEDSGTLRPSVTEFHAGRIFYGGVNATGYNSRIYFTKIVQGTADFGWCMTDNDQTTEVFDFLPSDGGIIAIPQAGTIYKLVSFVDSLLVFGANGVWAITGSQGTGFSATDYTIVPISATRSISGASFVTLEGGVVWWNATGINMITKGQNGWQVQSLSDEKIKDFYLDIPTTAKRFARGAYNPRTHVIQWLYREEEFAGVTETYQFDRVLSFNTLIGAFYPWSIDVSAVSLNSIIVIEGSGSLTGSDLVVDNADVQVVDDLANDVITYSFSQTTITTTTKYLVYHDGGFTFAECFNVEYLDWTQADEDTDYTSYFITGYRILTQGQRRFQSNYVFVFTDLSDGINNEYSFQSLWNYGTSGNTGEWTQRQTVTQDITHAETNYDASRRRLKVRGSGTTVQFKFISVTGKPFNIVGWSTMDTANQSA